MKIFSKTLRRARRMRRPAAPIKQLIYLVRASPSGELLTQKQLLLHIHQQKPGVPHLLNPVPVLSPLTPNHQKVDLMRSLKVLRHLGALSWLQVLQISRAFDLRPRRLPHLP